MTVADSVATVVGNSSVHATDGGQFSKQSVPGSSFKAEAAEAGAHDALPVAQSSPSVAISIAQTDKSKPSSSVAPEMNVNDEVDDPVLPLGSQQLGSQPDPQRNVEAESSSAAGVAVVRTKSGREIRSEKFKALPECLVSPKSKGYRECARA